MGEQSPVTCTVTQRADVPVPQITEEFLEVVTVIQLETKRGCRDDGDGARPAGVTVRSGHIERAGHDHERVPDETPQA